MTAKAIRLRAVSAEDVEIISACSQDAVVRVADMAYDPGRRRFVLLMNRYCWERDSEKRGLFDRSPPARVRSALRFEFVDAARVQALDLSAKERVLELLALHVEEGLNDSATVELIFAGDAAIRLEVECIDAFLEDLSSPWTARRRPDHGAA